MVRYCNMPKERKGPERLTLDRLRTGAIFKVVKDGEYLTLSGVYHVMTAKADHGKNVTLADLAHVRKVSRGAFTYSSGMKIPRERAKAIEVYRILSGEKRS